MKNKVRTQKTVELTFNILFVLLETLLYFVLLRSFYKYEIVYYAKGYILLMLLYAGLLTVFIKLYEAYRLTFSKLSDLVLSVTLSILLTNAIIYIQYSLKVNYLLGFNKLAIVVLIQIIVGWIILYFEWNILYKLFPAKSTLMVFEGEHKETLNKLKRYGDRNFKIEKAINFNNLEYSLLNDYDYVLLVNLSYEAKKDITNYCYRISKSVYEIPSINDILTNNAKRMHLIDTPLLCLNKFGPAQYDKIIKRFIDFTASAIGLIVLSPIAAIVAIFIKLEDKGPALYSQVRLTQYGKEFNIYKFRSMKIDAEADGVAQVAKQEDDRITKVGKIIRKFRLDEIPQLYNILVGDMSIVGPRPERPQIANKLYEEFPEFEYRLKVKAGLTGYAQVYGKYNTTLKDKLLLDLMYIENYSIFLDIKIILMTVKTIFVKDSTEGFAKEDKNG